MKIVYEILSVRPKKEEYFTEVHADRDKAIDRLKEILNWTAHHIFEMGEDDKPEEYFDIYDISTLNEPNKMGIIATGMLNYCGDKIDYYVMEREIKE